MTKRFKLKISRILLSFKSCRSKDSSSLPFDPVPSIPRRLPPPVNPSAAKQRRRSSFRLHMLTTCGCGSSRRRSSTPVDDGRRGSPSLSPQRTPTFQWESEANERDYETRRRKIYDGGQGKDDQRRSGKKERHARRRGSTSSAEEYEEEIESLLPSSNSTNLSPEDSSSELPRVTRKSRRTPKKTAIEEESESSSPAAAVGVAVVKRSEDPYEDFKGSMMEMIVEKKMFEVAELEQLLRCFLSLNAKRHHRAIVRAFSAVWVDLFSGGGRRSSSFSTVRLSDYEEC